MRVHYVQHVPFEDAGAIAEWTALRGHSLERTLAVTAQFPAPEEYDMLVLMGGPMGVHDVDRHGWLAPEKMVIDAALASDALVLGVCLGAQLVAEALGAVVRTGPYKEIGWFPVELTPEARGSAAFGGLPERFVALHWHGDTFDIPDGASHVAQTRGYANQAFSWDGGRVVGLQFHLECTNEGVRAMAQHGRADFDGSRWVQPAPGLVSGEERWGASSRHVLFQLLDAMERVWVERPKRPRPVEPAEAPEE